VVFFILAVLMGGLCAAVLHQVFVSGRATSITGGEWLRYGLFTVLLVVSGARWVRASRTLMRWSREMSGGGAPPAA
jgi:Zn-dependent protease with chaperone function